MGVKQAVKGVKKAHIIKKKGADIHTEMNLKDRYTYAAT
jgi:hypothetical protein